MKSKNLIASFKYAFEGLFLAIRSERNLKIHLVAAVLMSLVALYLKFSITDYILVLLCIGLVISAEIINTTIEDIMDFMTGEFDPRVKRIKDLAAGTVLVIAMISAIIGGLLIIKYVKMRF